MDIYKLLRNSIQSQINKSELYGSDCNILSQKILKKTQRQISSSTIKRFFGLIKCNYKPSKYTLDTFAEFIGYKNWDDFKTCNDDILITNNTEVSWNILNNRTSRITLRSLSSLKQKANYKKEEFIFRQQEKKRFEEFEANTLPATLFIAPDGYGKSTILIQLVEEYFLQEGKRYQHDIVCLIDGEIFFDLYSRNGNIDIINELLEFNINSKQNISFQKYHEIAEGRFWLIIDDFDDIFYKRRDYIQLIENLTHIMMMNEGDWFKVILTCRPENIDAFNCVLHKRPFLKSLWFDVDFAYENYIDTINIPQLNTTEIKALFKLHQIKSQSADIFRQFDDILEIVSKPYLCSVFIDELKRCKNISEIYLLNHLIKAEILSPPLIEEKLLLLERYVSLCERGQVSYWIEKNQLLSDSNITPAYNQLISYGILYEIFRPTNTVDLRIIVNFTQKTILEYIIFLCWIKKNEFTTPLFFKILDYYNSNQIMQHRMMSFFIKTAMHHGKFEVLEKVKDKLLKKCTPKKGCNEDDLKHIRDSLIIFQELMEKNNELQNIFSS
ncbi:hypothetical protein [uncultured Draconibacterium sp.]|uniref:hypothetical protein n=1 Tax=uncultured Draconibacterium sp. TaxID=1573823 RepID=UPI0032607F6C